MERRIKNIIKEWKEEAKARRIIQFNLDPTGTLYIYTSEPGYLIGRFGSLYNKYHKELRKNSNDRVKKVVLVETSSYSV